MAVEDLLAALVATPLVGSSFRGALPPVDLRAVCFVLAMIMIVVLRWMTALMKSEGTPALRQAPEWWLLRCSCVSTSCLPARLTLSLLQTVG